MATINVHEAKTNSFEITEMVAHGEKITTAKRGVSMVDLQPNRSKKVELKFGTMANRLHYKDADFVGTDPDIQELFYSKGS